MWRARQVIAKAYDNPIPGYKTSTVGNLRLWEALPLNEFDLDAFNRGEYDKVRAPLHHPLRCIQNVVSWLHD